MKGLFEVFYRPGVLFAGLPERRGAWVAPLIANCLLIVLMTFLVPHYVGRENMMRQQHRPEPAIASAGSAARVYGDYAGAAISMVLMLLVVATALFAFGLMTSRAPRFVTMFSMVSLAFFPYWLIATAITAGVLATAADPAALHVQNLLPTNVAAWMDRDATEKALYSLAGSLDLLSFAEIGLLSYGFATLTRVSVFLGLAAVVGLWILYISSMALSSLVTI